MDGVRTGQHLLDHYMAKANEPLEDCERRSKLAETKAVCHRHGQFLNAELVAECFGLEKPNCPDGLGDAYAKAQAFLAEYEVKREAINANREAAKAKRAAAAIELRRANIPAWLAGECVNVSGLPVMLRTRRPLSAKDGESCILEIETSLGAAIPYADGRKCFEFAMRLRAKGWHRNGEQFEVGRYQLDAINEYGIIAGCHRIAWGEIERFAIQEGWITHPDINNPALDIAEAQLTPEQ